MTDPNQILKKYWGYDQFRTLQLEIIQSVTDGKDTLALLPTGGGKSVCFQVPALLLDGITIVVTPLIALMKDQVQQLMKRGIKATAIYSGMSTKEIDVTLDNCVYGSYKLLYVSPERLATEMFIARAQKMNISLLAIDEAHCISQWGHDFRPPYLLIKDFKNQLEVKRVIALTASATDEIREDIVKHLEMHEPAIFQKSYARSNLSYSVFKLENKEQKMYQILQNVPGTAIVYARTRKRTATIAGWLKKNGIDADYYHAGLSARERNARQENWINNQVRVIVATNAFGMGIDKADVRVVIHLDVPETLEAYYQEAGRAGRDEHKAYAVALYHEQDIIDGRQRIERASVDLDLIKRVYQALANKYKLAIGSGEGMSFDFDYNEFVAQFNLPMFQTLHALKKMEVNGLIQLSDGVFQQSKLHILIGHEEVYKFQVAHVKLDQVLKVLLRLYGGELYSDYLTIKEGDIAQLSKTSTKEIVKDLQTLHQFEIIDYHQAAFGPHIDYLTPRMDVANLPIEAKVLNKRKEVAVGKFEAVVKYLEQNQCRTRMLQAYFDEQSDENCGVCDYCVGKKSPPGEYNRELIMAAIGGGGIAIEKLIKDLAGSEKEIRAQIRSLIEDGIIYLESESILFKTKSP